jgi:hypothetical protein
MGTSALEPLIDRLRVARSGAAKRLRPEHSSREGLRRLQLEIDGHSTSRSGMYSVAVQRELLDVFFVTPSSTEAAAAAAREKSATIGRLRPGATNKLLRVQSAPKPPRADRPPAVVRA